MGKVTPDDMVNEDAPCQILSIKLSMTVLVILLSLGIVAVAVMFSTVNIVSLIGMKEKLEDSNLSLMTHLIETELNMPMLFAETVSGVIASGQLDPLDYVAHREFLYYMYKKAQNVITKVSVGSSIFYLSPPRTVGYGGSALGTPYQKMISWPNVTKPGMENFYFVPFETDTKNSNYSNPFLTVPFMAANAGFIKFAKEGETKWMPAQLQCFNPTKCTITFLYIAVVKDPVSQQVFAFSTYATNINNLGKEMTRFSSKIPGSTAILIERNSSNIFAHSNPKYPPIAYGNGTASFIECTKSADKVTAFACKQLLAKYGNRYEGMKESGSFSAVEKGTGRVYINYAPYNNGKGLDWIIVVAIPQKQFIGSFITSVTVAIVLAILLIFVALLVGGVFGYVTVRPIGGLVKQIKLVETMRLEDVVQEFSWFSEIANMQHSFYIVVNRLKEYKSFLPAAIVNRDYCEDDSFENEEGTLLNKDKNNGMTPNDITTRSSVVSTAESTREGHKFSLGLDYINGVILIGSISNFDSLFGLLGTEFLSFYDKLLREVTSITKRTKGSLVSFSEDEFVIVWTTHSYQKYNNAARCALAIRDTVNRHIKLSHKQSSIRIGLVEGGLYNGNIGTASQRVPRVFGSAHRTAKALISISEEWNCSIVVSDAFQANSSSQYVLLPLTEVTQPNKVEDTTLEINRTRVYQLVDRVTTVDQEWMYEMNKDTIMLQYEKFRQAYQFMEVGRFVEARELFNEYSAAFPDDIVSRKLSALCTEDSLGPRNPKFVYRGSYCTFESEEQKNEM